MREAMEAFAAEGVDMCICLGDIIDKGQTPEEPRHCLSEAMAVIRSYGILYFIVPGNHDFAVFSREEFSSYTGCPALPCALHSDTYTVIFLDANYRSDMVHYSEGEYDWKNSNLPTEQLEFLSDTLAASEKPCIVCVHENLDNGVRPDHVVKNADAVRELLEKSGKVPLVIQGHYHKGAYNVINGIRYLTLSAMCEGEDNHYIITEV